MANTSAVYARIDTNLKDNAESILSQLGIKAGKVYSADEIDAALAKEFGI